MRKIRLNFFRIVCGLLALFSFVDPAGAQEGLEKFGEGFEGYRLTDKETAIYNQYFPKTFAKLQRQQPVHIVVMGDSIANMLGYGTASYDWLKSFHGVFVGEICRQFYYPGGVRLVKQRKNKPKKVDDTIGAEVTLRNMARNGSTSLHLFQRLTTDAFFNEPDIVIINYGINDALAGIALDTYREAISRGVDFAKSKGSEVILLGPAVIVADTPALKAMSITRPYSSIMREIAEEKGVFFADLGDISGLVGGTPPGIPADHVPRNIEFAIKEFFNHGPDVVDFIHPNAEGHRRLGKRAFSQLIKPREDDYVVTQSTANIDGENLKLTLKLTNRSGQRRELTVVPMPLAKAYQTSDPPQTLTLEPDAETEIVLNYLSNATAESSPGFRYDLLPGFEEFVRGSIICSDEGQTYFADFKATITPVAFNWKTEAKFNVANKFSVGGNLVNTGTEALTADVTAEWGGQRGSGRAIVPPGGTHSLAFEFQFPNDAGLFRDFSEVILTVKAGDRTHTFRRGIEVSRNIGLSQTISMIDVTGEVPGEPKRDGSRSVRFRSEADEKALYLIFEMQGFDIVSTPQAPGGVAVDISLDARSYGKRQEFGFVDQMRISTGSIDGTGKCAKLWPAYFGNGYALEIDEKNITSNLQTLPGGIRRLTVGVPRNYLYLHEFALGNGNSQLGIDALLTVQEQDGSNAPIFGNRYSIVASGMHRNNAQSLTTLELAKPATKRWSVRIF